MSWSKTRFALLVVDGFAAASAVAGGLAVMFGWIKFPAEWLAGSSWNWLVSDYFVAGAILLLVAGGTAVAATVATGFRTTIGAGFSAAAGLVMIGWIVAEVVILAQVTWLQPFYAAVGLLMIALAVAVDPPPARVVAHRLHLNGMP